MSFTCHKCAQLQPGIASDIMVCPTRVCYFRSSVWWEVEGVKDSFVLSFDKCIQFWTLQIAMRTNLSKICWPGNHLRHKKWILYPGTQSQKFQSSNPGTDALSILTSGLCFPHLHNRCNTCLTGVLRINLVFFKVI